jgi:hypothetical protein
MSAIRNDSRLRLRSAFLGLWLSTLAMGCPKKDPIQQKPEVDPATLFLEPVPTIVATLAIDSPERQWVGPTRLQTDFKAKPLRLELEDFDQAEPVVMCIESVDPAAFCQALDAASDNGTIRRTDQRLEVDLDRVGYDDKSRHYELRVNLTPEEAAPPENWLTSGTTLYFGRAFDSKPVTKTIPLGLNVRLGSTSDGGRLFTWTADIDKRAEKEVTTATQRSGRRLLSAGVVESATQHSDAFLSPESMGDATGSLFLSRKTLADAIRYGGAAFHDSELSRAGVLVVTGRTHVTVQAGEDLWRIPAVVAAVNGGEGVYVVADDPANPLILSASRPGYQIRLMAIGTPSAR